jgi:RES domain-containing protein
MAPEIPTTEIRHGGFRYSNYDTPFWSRPNTLPGRWHLPEDGPTQYLSLSPDGAWAELIRYEQLQSEWEIAQIRTKIWVADLNIAHLVDYSTFEKAEAAGFDPDALVDEDYAHCQEEGARLRSLGYRGVVAPSAALPEATNVTLFGARYSVRWNARVATASAIPATVVAIGSPQPGLLPRVRQHGDAHEGLRLYELPKEAEGEDDEAGRGLGESDSADENTS